MGLHSEITGIDLHESRINIVADSPVVLNLSASIAGILVCDNRNRIWKANSTDPGDWYMVSGFGADPTKVLKAGDTMTGSLEVIGTVKATAFEGDGSGVVLPIAITDENPTGPRSGNKIFTIAFAPIENSEAVYLNGLKQVRVDDYAMTGQDIEFVDPPLDDDTIRVDYRYLA